jgi:hypothetical protein
MSGEKIYFVGNKDKRRNLLCAYSNLSARILELYPHSENGPAHTFQTLEILFFKMCGNPIMLGSNISHMVKEADSKELETLHGHTGKSSVAHCFITTPS